MKYSMLQHLPEILLWNCWGIFKNTFANKSWQQIVMLLCTETLNSSPHSVFPPSTLTVPLLAPLYPSCSVCLWFSQPIFRRQHAAAVSSYRFLLFLHPSTPSSGWTEADLAGFPDVTLVRRVPVRPLGSAVEFDWAGSDRAEV